MKPTWIVVAEQSRARIFETDEGGPLRLIRDVVHGAGRSHNRDMESDRPGTGFSRVGPGRRALEKDGHGVEHSTLLFVSEVANYLDQARHLGRFVDLKIVAPPTFLGELRKQLSNPTLKLVSATHSKDFARASTAELLSFMEREGLFAGTDDGTFANADWGTKESEE